MASSDDLERWYQEAGKYRNLDPHLLRAIARTESGERIDSPDSHAGAIGLMQIMPQTAKSLGIDPRDPQQAIYGAARLIDENLKHYGNLPDALRAYNGGTDRAKWGNNETMAYTRKVAANLSPSSQSTAQEPDFTAMGKALDGAAHEDTSKGPDFVAMGKSLDSAPGSPEPAPSPRANPHGFWNKAGIVGGDTLNAAGREVGRTAAGVEDLLGYIASLGHLKDNAASEYLNHDADAVRQHMGADEAARSGDYGAGFSNIVGGFAGDGLAMAAGGRFVRPLVQASKVAKAGRAGRIAANALLGEGSTGSMFLNNALSAGVQGEFVGNDGLQDGVNALMISPFAHGAAKLVAKSVVKAGGWALNHLDPEGRYMPELDVEPKGSSELPNKGWANKDAAREAGEKSAEADHILETAHEAHDEATAHMDATAAAASQARRASMQNPALQQAAQEARGHHESALQTAVKTRADVETAADRAVEAHSAAEQIRAIDEAAPKRVEGESPSTDDEQAQASRVRLTLALKDIPKLTEDTIRTFGRSGPLQLSPSPIPGVHLTLAEQSGNAGIATQQLALQNLNPGIKNAMTLRKEANNQAIKDYFKNEIAKTPEDIEAAELARRRFGDQHFNEVGPVFGNEQPVYAAHIGEELRNIATNPRTPEHIVQAIMPYQRIIERNVDPESGLAMPSHLYAARRTLAHAITRKMDSEGRDIKESLPALGLLRSAMDHTIERGAPGYKAAMKSYADMSRQIDEMRWLQSQTTETAAGMMTHGRVKQIAERLRRDAIAKGTRPSDAISPEIRKKIATLLETTSKIEHLNLAKTIGSNSLQNLYAADTVKGIMAPAAAVAKVAAAAHFNPVAGALMHGAEWAASGRTGKLRAHAMDHAANALLNPDQALIDRVSRRK